GGCQPEVWVRLMSSVTTQALSSISLTLVEPITGRSMESILRRIPKNAPLTELWLSQQLAIHPVDAAEELAMASEALTSSVLGHILSFKSLTCLTLFIGSGFDIDDDTIHQVACSMPSIFRLELSSVRPYFEHFPRLTLNCLIHLSQNCFSLR